MYRGKLDPESFTGKWCRAEKKPEAIPAAEEDMKKNYRDGRYVFVPFGLNEDKK